MNAACPPVHELESLLANQLGEADEQTLENHVATCLTCQGRLEELTHGSCAQGARRLDHGAIIPSPRRGGGILAKLSHPSSSSLALAQANGHVERPRRVGKGNSFGSSAAWGATSRFLRRQLWTWPLIAAALLGSAGWWVNRSVENAMRDQRVSELTTVLEADIAALREWMNNQRATAELVAGNEQLAPLADELIAIANDTAEMRNHLVRSPAQAAIRLRLAEALRRGKYIGFLLVSPSGVALAADQDATVGADLFGYRQEFFAGVNGGDAAVSKPLLSPFLLPDAQGELRANQPCMYTAAPIRDGTGQSIAALGLLIRPDDQFTRILRVARSGKSGETYAFDRAGVLLSQSRFEEHLKQIGLLVDQPDSRSILAVEVRDPGVNMVEGQRPTTRRTDQKLTRMAQDATQGRSGHDVEGYRDYRGVPVVGAWRWLDEYDFGVTTEVDVAEAFAPLYILRRAIAVLMGLLTLAAFGILLAMLLLARQRQQLHEANLAAEQFGQYTLVEKLGTGGMGTVYKARHALLRRPTAVKLLNQEVINDTAIARFEREVQLTSGLTHPNTVAIYDYGRTASGVFYYAMEFLEGINLDELVKQFGPLPEARAVYVLRQVCSSLSEAHAAGLVHRDIKPANIILTFRGGLHDFVKVLDFGLAKLAGDLREPALTSANVVAGTPHYVAPEAVTRPEQIDARADVYAIGAVGYFLLTGSPVFDGSSAADICLMHVWATPEGMSARLGRELCPELEALLLRCLAKAPADRPADASELLCELAECPVPGSWTASDAARWWADRLNTHTTETKVLERV